MRKSSLALAISVFSVAYPRSEVRAQVNTEKLRQEQPVEGFGGFLSSSLALTQGNTNRLRVDSGFRAQYETVQDLAPIGSSTVSTKTTKNLFFIVGEVGFEEVTSDSGNEVYVNRSFVHARWTRMWFSMMGTEVFSQVQYDQSIRLQLRALGGASARFALIESELADIYFGTGYMFEHEALDVPAPQDVNQNHRWTNYLSFSLKLLDNKVALISTGYAQPRFDDFGDFRIINEATLSVAVHEHLELGIVLNLRYDSQPPPEVDEKLDLGLTNMIKLTF